MSPATTQPTPTSRKTTAHATQPTLVDHLHELRARLFWIVLSLILTSSASYFIQDQVMAVLMQPLGGQRLVYLTPIGGFSFMFKVSIYFGIALILPVIVYHIYRFLEPLMQKHRKRSVVAYSIASFLLAIGGGCFAYFGGLPAAMHFLTGFNIQNVSAMLTVDSYLSFVVAYVLGFAALSQIPLILMIINTIKPIPPKKLMGFQQYVILAAFILAAIISPTPDVTNQTILAIPIILMYQVGIFMVWSQSRASRRRQAKVKGQGPIAETFKRTTSAVTPVKIVTQRQTATQQISVPAIRSRAHPTRPVMDIAAPHRIARPIPALHNQRAVNDNVHRAPIVRLQPRPLNAQSNTIDGIVRRTQQLPQAG